MLINGASTRRLPESNHPQLDETPKCLKLFNRALETLSRYLAFEAVRAGEAHRRAHDDYYAFRQQSEAAANFEAVGAELLREPPEVLKDWFCGEVERTSGVRPDLRAAFTRGCPVLREIGTAFEGA